MVSFALRRWVICDLSANRAADDAKSLALEELQLPPQSSAGGVLICSGDNAVSAPGGEAVDDSFPVNDVGVHRLIIPFRW